MQSLETIAVLNLILGLPETGNDFLQLFYPVYGWTNLQVLLDFLSTSYSFKMLTKNYFRRNYFGSIKVFSRFIKRICWTHISFIIFIKEGKVLYNNSDSLINSGLPNGDHNKNPVGVNSFTSKNRQAVTKVLFYSITEDYHNTIFYGNDS